ncbi:MAG: PTS transporter subunit EIIA [candidate division Zixibacteria bacterium]|nr:PTS transporter subunit EIIA [candidate division Zixibacteria bacterium]
MVKISEFVDSKGIKMELTAQDKEGVLRELVSLAAETGKITDELAILKAVRERENLCSTGFENGAAIPHPRQGHPDIVKELVAVFGRAAKGIDFEALDEKPVQLFFLLCAPTDSEHLRALAKLSRFLKKEQVRKSLLEAKTPDEVLAVIKEEEV